MLTTHCTVDAALQIETQQVSSRSVVCAVTMEKKKTE